MVYIRYILKVIVVKWTDSSVEFCLVWSFHILFQKFNRNYLLKHLGSNVTYQVVHIFFQKHTHSKLLSLVIEQEALPLSSQRLNIFCSGHGQTKKSCCSTLHFHKPTRLKRQILSKSSSRLGHVSVLEGAMTNVYVCLALHPEVSISTIHFLFGRL